ncbi:hypothetical protein TRVA0_012S03158 [Trichomonascus vanleenenianus]|uniref:putative AAA family ATPase SAP1 n=1 Tax=Trichomonascus vanleenenianus TaxID=2268995 RepID=UPI003ECAA7A7
MNLFRQRPSVQDSLQRTYDDAYQSSVKAILLETRSEPRQALDAWNTTLRDINKALSEMSAAPRTGSEKSLMESIRDIERQCHDRISFLEYRKYQKGPYLDMPSTASPVTSPGNNHSSVDLSARKNSTPNASRGGYNSGYNRGGYSSGYTSGVGSDSGYNGGGYSSGGYNGGNPFGRQPPQESAVGYSNEYFDSAFGISARKSSVPPPKPPKPPAHVLMTRKQGEKNNFDDLFKNFEGSFEPSALNLYDPSAQSLAPPREPVTSKSAPITSPLQPSTSHYQPSMSFFEQQPPIPQQPVTTSSQPLLNPVQSTSSAQPSQSTAVLKPNAPPSMPQKPPPPPPPPRHRKSESTVQVHQSQTQPVMAVSSSSSPGSSRDSLEPPPPKPKSHSTPSIGNSKPAKAASTQTKVTQQPSAQQYTMLRTLRTAKPGKISNGAKQPAANKAATLAWGDRSKAVPHPAKLSFEVVRTVPAKPIAHSTSPGAVTPRPKLTSARSTPITSTPAAKAKPKASMTAAKQVTRPPTVYPASSVRKGTAPLTTAAKKPSYTTRPSPKQQQKPPQATKVQEKLVPAGVDAETKESSSEEDSKDMSEIDKKAKKVMKELKGIDENAAKQILNEIVVRGDEVHWDDIAGLEQAKSSLKEAVVYPFLRPDLFSGLREPARGMLLFGPPGTGKTMLARAVATESNSTFFSISASSLTSKFLGESEKLVRALFYMAKQFAPSIIFVDEIDSLLSTRSEAGEHEASRRIKNEFLVQWSELQSAAAGRERDDVQRVLVLAATNLPWGIDEAARRRFVRRQYIPLPERETRKYQLNKLLSHQNHALSEADIERLLGLTEGFSGSDITALAKDAAMGPLRSLGEALLTTPREQIRPIRLEDFECSLLVIRPSVSKEGLRAFEEWAKEFGSSGA